MDLRLIWSVRVYPKGNRYLTLEVKDKRGFVYATHCEEVYLATTDELRLARESTVLAVFAGIDLSLIPFTVQACRKQYKAVFK